MTDILFLAYDFLEDYRARDYYIEYINLNKTIESNYQKEITDFNKIKDTYEQVLEVGRFHPDFKEVTKEYRVAKINFFLIEDIKRYYELTSLIEKEINELFNSVSSSISSNIPVLNEFGFMSNAKGGSCSGSCR